mgnify:CR=1 FL=1
MKHNVAATETSYVDTVPEASNLVYVVRADSTPYQVAKGGIDLLKKGKAHLLGVVLNQLNLEKAERYYGYGKYISYGGKYGRYKKYGYTYGENKKRAY